KDSRRLFVRTDLLLYDAGIVTVHWRAEVRTSRSRVRDERAATPAALLARDPRNRYIPWGAIREVRIESLGIFIDTSRARAMVVLRDGERLRFAVGSNFQTDFVTCVQDFIPEESDQASDTSSSRSSLQ